MPYAFCLKFKKKKKKIVHQFVNSNLQIHGFDGFNLKKNLFNIRRDVWICKNFEKEYVFTFLFFTIEWKLDRWLIEEEILKKLDALKSGKTKCSTTFYHKVTRVERSTIFFHYNLVFLLFRWVLYFRINDNFEEIPFWSNFKIIFSMDSIKILIFLISLKLFNYSMFQLTLDIIHCNIYTHISISVNSSCSLTTTRLSSFSSLSTRTIYILHYSKIVAVIHLWNWKVVQIYIYISYTFENYIGDKSN